MPLGFFVVAFPPPPVTFPATRLVSEDSSGVALIWLIISKERCSFLSKQLGMTFRSSLASLSASTPSVPGSGFPLLLPSNDRVTTFVPPLGAGQVARKQSRLCNQDYTHYF